MLDVRFRPMGPIAKRGRIRAKFQSKYSDTLDLLETELGKIQARSIVIEAGYSLDQIRNDGWPRSSARPTHPDVRLSFNSKGKEMAFPCGTYTALEDNLRAIALTLEALRAINRYGVTQEDQQYRGFAALPAPDPQVDERVRAAVLVARLAGGGYHGAHITSDSRMREDAYRLAAKKTHPDSGGRREDWDQLQRAIEVLRGGKAAHG